MLVIAFFTALPALLIVAMPLPVNHRPTAVDSKSRSTLYRRAPPKFEIPPGFVAEPYRTDTIKRMMEHYETKSTNAQKGAGLASATSRWNSLPPGREYMKFKYHAGGTTESPVIGNIVKIYRDKLAPKTHFLRVPEDHREEMELEGAKRLNDLNPYTARRVRSVKTWGDWNLDDGIREKTKITFHSSTSPRINNQIGDPMTITRPLTLQFPDVIGSDKHTMNHEVREAHKKMVADPQHPATTSNYGTIHSNWHDSLPDANGKTHKQVIVGLEEVSENETERKPLGDYAIHMGTGNYEPVGLNTGGLSSHAAAGTSHAGPSQVNNEVARPPNSQEQQHLDVSSPSTHALSSNSGSSHLNSQGLQFNAGSPSSHPGPSLPPGPSHPELLHAGSPQQPLQPTGSPPLHNEFHMPWEPESQPPRHPGLYTDPLWYASLPHPQSPPPNSQILPHPSRPSLHLGLGNPGPSLGQSPTSVTKMPPHPSSPSLELRLGNPGTSSHPELLHAGSSQQLPQPTGNQPLHNEFYMPWEPAQSTRHPGLYGDQLWHTDSPHLQSLPPDSEIPHPNTPSLQLRLGPPSPGPSHLVLPQQPLQPTGNQPLHPDA